MCIRMHAFSHWGQIYSAERLLGGHLLFSQGVEVNEKFYKRGLLLPKVMLLHNNY